MRYEINYVAYREADFGVVATSAVFNGAFKKVLNMRGIKWINVTEHPPVLAAINEANGTTFGEYYIRKLPSGKRMNVHRKTLLAAASELQSCLKICHKIDIPHEVINEVLFKYFPGDVEYMHSKGVTMPYISGLAKTFMQHPHFYITFKVK